LIFFNWAINRKNRWIYHFSFKFWILNKNRWKTDDKPKKSLSFQFPLSKIWRLNFVLVNQFFWFSQFSVKSVRGNFQFDMISESLRSAERENTNGELSWGRKKRQVRRITRRHGSKARRHARCNLHDLDLVPTRPFIQSRIGCFGSFFNFYHPVRMHSRLNAILLNMAREMGKPDVEMFLSLRIGKWLRLWTEGVGTLFFF
jgi:hypothetical protein